MVPLYLFFGLALLFLMYSIVTLLKSFRIESGPDVWTKPINPGLDSGVDEYCRIRTAISGAKTHGQLSAVLPALSSFQKKYAKGSFYGATLTTELFSLYDSKEAEFITFYNDHMK